MDNNNKNNGPFASINDRNISCGIFLGPNGFSINFQRSYQRKGESDRTRETIHFFEDDLLKAAQLLQEAYMICRENRSEAKKFREEHKQETINKALNDNVPF